MDGDSVIKVEHIFKDFVLPQERVSSVKGVFTNIFKVHKGGKAVQHALHDVSFDIKKGEFFGIVGRNGSGKSTMLKILAGIYQPTKGSVATKGKLVPFIELGVGFNGELTGRENIYLNGAILGFSRKQIDDMYNDIVSFAELEKFMDQKLKNYSSGMQVRLAFSMAIRSDAEILVVDEVLAVGDADFQRKCYQYFKNLKRAEKTVVFVSHDMHAIEEYCDRALLIEDSKVVVAGSSHEVALAYTRMFLDQTRKTDMKRQRRWGGEQVKYTKVTPEPSRLRGDGNLTIRTVAMVKKDVTTAVFGFKIRATDDTQLFGTNTRLKKQHLDNLHKGNQIIIEWQVPNVLNTGNYFVDVAIQSADYDEVYDWWEGAAQLQVERDEENSYPFHPVVSVTVSKK